MSLLSPARLFTASIVTIACLFPANTMSAENTASLSNTAARPNVLFIAIDDLNDWVGCLNGHPQAQTPNIDRLARRGVLFTNAHVQATFCGPSRMSLLSGRFPASTGAYGFEPTYDRQPALKDLPSLPEWFRRHGYRTVGGGKIYHQGIQQGNAGGFEEDLGFGGSGPRPKELLNWHVPIWDFGPFPDRDEQVDNYRMAQAGADVLTAPRGEKPLFLAVGFRRPHVPLYAPQKWFDLYPAQTLHMPTVFPDDLDDVPQFARDLALTDAQIAPTHEEVVSKGKWSLLVQSYLACISFTDHCVGLLLEALQKSPDRDNTIVVLWSDHGWHLGEKQHWAKRTLWEETTRVPLIIAGPGITPESCSQPVMLLDLYPTLCDLTGIPQRAQLEGTSLHPLLTDVRTAWNRPAVTTLDPGSHSIRDQRWRYIRYADGSEELYDHQTDPNEQTNVVVAESNRDIIRSLAEHLPKNEAPPVAAPERKRPERKRPVGNNRREKSGKL